MKKIGTFFVTLFFVFSISLTARASSTTTNEYYGTAGRLIVANTSISVPMDYFQAGHLQEAQKVVNQRGKAVYQDFSNLYSEQVSPLIGDHRNQGFEQLYATKTNESVAEIQFADGTVKKYICREVDRNGHNSENGIYDSQGNYPEIKYPSNWIVIYTCNPAGWRSITVTYWEPVAEEF